MESEADLLQSVETCSGDIALPSFPSKMILILNTLNLKQAGTTYWYTLKITFATCLLISIGSRWISSEDREGEEKRLLIIVASSTVFLLAVHRLIKDLAILSTADQVIAIISIIYEMFSSQSDISISKKLNPGSWMTRLRILLSRMSFNPVVWPTLS